MIKKDKTGYVECPVKLKTNTLNVEFNKKAFFNKYAIVSYTTVGDYKNVSYERFLDVPYLSVFGCGDYWDETYYTKFFVLVKRNDEQIILNCLSKVGSVRANVDDLEEYDDYQVKRIVVSLALNSLSGDFENSHRIFSNGILTVWNDDNFTIYRNKNNNPIVGLDITLNKYLNLNANTKSFWKVSDIEYVKNKWRDTKRLFKVNFTKNNKFTITPFSLEHFDEIEKEKNLYEEKSMGRNVVPFWPFSIQKYQSGKLVVLWNIVKQLNSQFKDILKVKFNEYSNLVIDKNLTKDDALRFIKKTLSGKVVLVEDSVETAHSKTYMENVINHLRKVYYYSEFIKDGDSFDCKIQLLSNREDDSYLMGVELMKQGFVTQHLLLNRSEEDDSKEKTKDKEEENKPLKDNDPTIRRIMLELAVKVVTKEGRLDDYAESAGDWAFYKFKRVKGHLSNKDIIGGKLTVNENGSMNFVDFCGNEIFYDFCKNQLRIKDTKFIDSKKEYFAIEKNNNLYLIVRTEEIPMMDVDQIESSYDKIESDVILFESILTEYEERGASSEDIKKVFEFAEDQNLIVNDCILARNVSKISNFIKKNNPAFENSKERLFNKSLKGRALLSMFKRESLKETMLGGYQGIHTWKSNGIYDENDAFNYMVGTNSTNLQIKECTVFDKVPHTYSVFPLRIENLERKEEDRLEILNMLSYGFGRWNEAMCYPFPFKFLTEHIERMCLENFNQHWKEVKDIVS